VVKAPVRSYLRSNDLSNFDLIFADPPYVSDEGSLTLLALSKHAKSLQDSLVILEHSSLNEMNTVPESLFVIDRRKYGDVSILIMGFNS
jgi:16S rRNA G966 N2-methylase RsmD